MHNAANSILELLDSLSAQTCAPEEVLLIDDGSTDTSFKIVSRWLKEHPELNGSILRQDQKGPAEARNLGASVATQELLLFVDSDCAPTATWVETMKRPFLDSEVVGVQGAYLCRQKEWMARFTQLEIEERYCRMAKAASIDFIGTYAAAYLREVFLEQGSFDTRFEMASGEDADFSFRLSSHGLKMVFEPEAEVYHQHPTTLRCYLHQKYWRAYWRNRIYRKHFSKVWKDTYTPDSLKLQTVLGALLPFSLLGIFFSSLGFLVPACVFALILISSFPFSTWVFKRNAMLGLCSPVVVVLRSVALASGAVHGAMRGLWLPEEK